MVKLASVNTQKSLNYYESLIGSTFNYVKIIDFKRRFDNYNDLRFKVKCICGKEFYPLVFNVINNKTTSCGCNRYERVCKVLILPNNEALINRIFEGYVRHAKDKNISFEFTKKEFSNFMFKCCNYCGVEPIERTKVSKAGKITTTFSYNGIDRKNTELGYTIENCVTCCQNCNFAKKELTLDEFYSWIEKLAKNNNFIKEINE